MQTTKLLKLSALINLAQLVALAAALAWLGKLYLTDKSNSVDLENYRSYVTSLFKANQWVGRYFPVIPVQTTHGDTIHTDFTGTKGGLVVLFDPSSCQPCLYLVLETLQHVHDRLENPAHLPIYAISPGPLAATQFSRAFSLKYHSGTLLLNEDKNYDSLIEKTPVVFLVDSYQKIIQCHYPLYEREQFTQLFFWKLVSTHLPVLNINTDRFADSPLRKLEGLSLLDVIERQHTFDNLF